MCDKPPKKPPKFKKPKCVEPEESPCEQECPEPDGKRRGPEPQNYCKKRCPDDEPVRRKPPPEPEPEPEPVCKRPKSVCRKKCPEPEPECPEPEPVCKKKCPEPKPVCRKKCPEPEPEPVCPEPEPVCKRACPEPKPVCKKKCPEPEPEPEPVCKKRYPSPEPICKKKTCADQGEPAPKVKKGAFICKPLQLYKKAKPKSQAKAKSKPPPGQYVAAKTKETSLGSLLLKDMFQLPHMLRIIGPKHVAAVTAFVPSICVFSAAWFLCSIYVADWRTVLQYVPYYGGKYEPAEPAPPVAKKK